MNRAQIKTLSLSNCVRRDKTREKIRQEKLVAYKETGVWPGSKAPVKKKEAWSEKKADKVRRKEKKQVKMEQKLKRKKRPTVDEDDWNELARDARLLKKFKKKKVHY